MRFQPMAHLSLNAPYRFALFITASVKMIIPLSDEIGMDVYARMGAYNEVFAAYGVDEVITYTPDDGANGEIYIFDNEYAQFAKAHADSYKEQPIAGCDNYDAFLHRYVQYAGCPLFSCVRIKRKATPTDNSTPTVRIDDRTPVKVNVKNAGNDAVYVRTGAPISVTGLNSSPVSVTLKKYDGMSIGVEGNPLIVKDEA